MGLISYVIIVRKRCKKTQNKEYCLLKINKSISISRRMALIITISLTTGLLIASGSAMIYSHISTKLRLADEISMLGKPWTSSPRPERRIWVSPELTPTDCAAGGCRK